MMCLAVYIFGFIYPTWTLLNFMGVYINFFHQIWEIFSHMLSCILFVPFSFWDVTYAGLPDAPQATEALLTVFILFSFCSFG